MKRGKYKTGVITSLDQVPTGFVQISAMDLQEGSPAQRVRRKRLLSDAHQMGYVRAVKLFRTASDHKTGPVFIDQAGAEEFIRWYEARVDAGRQADDAVEDARKAIAGQELRELIDVTTRLISSIRDLQAAIEVRSESFAAGGDE